jgi:hypothetical protein
LVPLLDVKNLGDVTRGTPVWMGEIAHELGKTILTLVHISSGVGRRRRRRMEVVGLLLGCCVMSSG